MLWLLVVALAGTRAQAALMPIDVSRLTVGRPAVVTEIDTGRLDGELRRLAWSDDMQTLYLQTAQGTAPALTLHHYTIALQGGAVTRIVAEPTWASEYWIFKQDRVAPGIASLELDVEQTQEIVKVGTGPAGVLDREGGGPDRVAAGGVSIDNLAKGTHGDQKVRVIRLRLLGELVGEWIGEPFNAGMKFGWGPQGSGAIVHVAEDGRLVFFDRTKHKQVVAGAKDAVLPAWSLDGSELAYLQKTGRKKYALMRVSVALR